MSSLFRFFSFFIQYLTVTYFLFFAFFFFSAFLFIVSFILLIFFFFFPSVSSFLPIYAYTSLQFINVIFPRSFFFFKIIILFFSYFSYSSLYLFFIILFLFFSYYFILLQFFFILVSFILILFKLFYNSFSHHFYLFWLIPQSDPRSLGHNTPISLSREVSHGTIWLSLWSERMYNYRYYQIIQSLLFIINFLTWELIFIISF